MISTITPNEQDYPNLSQNETDFENSASYLFSTHLPRFETELNVTTGQVNDDLALYYNQVTQLRSEMTATSSTLSTYVSVAGGYKDEALSAKNGAETAYDSTVALIGALDITATGGYTIDAVDDLLSRQRNLTLVGLNII